MPGRSGRGKRGPSRSDMVALGQKHCGSITATRGQHAPTRTRDKDLLAFPSDPPSPPLHLPLTSRPVTLPRLVVGQCGVVLSGVVEQSKPGGGGPS
eukprot:9488630-Alexandrium_andersonii.AAC.1